MKLYRLLLIIFFTAILFTCGCGQKSIKNESITAPVTSVITAVYKNCETLSNGDIKLIFRRMDNLEYIMFVTETTKLLSTGYPLIKSENGVITANNDYLNLKFDITFTEEKIKDDVSPEKILINRLYELKRVKSDRFTVAGIDDDIKADEFFFALKERIKINDSEGISKIISYPLTAIIKKKKVKIKTPDFFINNYKYIFNEKVTEAVINQPPADLKANQKGIMIGKGEIWINIINGALFITAINN